jgi:hypothetical protein
MAMWFSESISAGKDSPGTTPKSTLKSAITGTSHTQIFRNLKKNYQQFFFHPTNFFWELPYFPFS